MGYDVTFHPISLDDLHRYVFDVIEQPGLSEERASTMASDPAKRRAIEKIYEQLAEWARQLANRQSLPLNETFAYGTAQIAGFRHPYWYARNSAISMLDDTAVLDLFKPLTELPGAPICLRDTEMSSHIGMNYTASGVITDLDALEQHLKRLGLDGDSPSLFTVFDSATLASLREAIAYCKQHDLALIEGTDIVVPIVDEAGTDLYNFREAEKFDEPLSGDRQWFEPPRQDRQPAFDALQASTEPLFNDTVAVKRLLGHNRTGLLVPLYLVPDLDRKKYLHTKYDAVMYDDRHIDPVRRRRLKVLERASSHRDYRRRLFEHERSFYEERAESHPGQDIEAAQYGIGDIPERILESGLIAAGVGEWTIADSIFHQTSIAAEIIVRDKHTERDSRSYPGNLANVLRTQWFARALLDQSPNLDPLVEACEMYRKYAQAIRRSEWSEYTQRDYMEFVLTALVARRPGRALKMLDFRRPFDQQTELMSVYRAVATTQRGSETARAILEQCMQLLEVIRHPHGGKFLLSGRLTGIQLALASDQYLAERPAWSSIRDIAEWLGH